MTSGVPRAEQVNPPVERLFNVDTLNDDELVVIYRSIKAAADAAAEEGFEKAALGDNLCDRLALDVSDLAARDPERVKGLVNRCVTSDEEVDLYFVASIAGSLVHYDYEFTRDTLLSLFVNLDRAASGETSERAMEEIVALTHDVLNPEQIEDFNARVAHYGYDHPF